MWIWKGEGHGGKGSLFSTLPSMTPSPFIFRARFTKKNQPNQRGKVILIQHFDLVLGTVFELVLPVPSDQINCWIRYPIDLLIYESYARAKPNHKDTSRKVMVPQDTGHTCYGGTVLFNRANEIIQYLHNIVSSIQWFNLTDASWTRFFTCICKVKLRVQEIQYL